jgi:hypothetical protein
MNRLNMRKWSRFFVSLSILLPALSLATVTEWHFPQWGIEAHNFYQTDQENIILLQEWEIGGAERWQPISVPFFDTYTDVIQIRALFQIDSIQQKKELYFFTNGFNGATEIYLNDKMIQYEINAQIPIKVDLPSALLLTGQLNSIELRMKIPQKVEEGFPNYVHLFAEPDYLGITKPAFIGIKPSIMVDAFDYTILNFENVASIAYSFNLFVDEQILQAPERTSIDYSVFSQDDRLYHRRIRTIRDINTPISEEMKIPFSQLWSPTAPRQLKMIYYISKGTRVIHSDTLQLSFRSGQYDNGKFWINGQNIPIKGINYYKNYLVRPDQSYFERLSSDLNRIKNLGFNAIRCPNYFPDELFLNIADTLGLLVFAELPVRRYPVPLFQSDVLLNNIKSILSKISPLTRKHPSLFALGLGQELPLHEGNVQKFVLILKGFVESSMNIITYSAPLPDDKITGSLVTDFYLLDIYHPLQKVVSKNIYLLDAFTLAGRAAIVDEQEVYTWDTETTNIQRNLFINREIKAIREIGKFQGGFIEGYQDWLAKHPTHVTIKTPDPLIMPSGFVDYSGELKPWFSAVENVWESPQDSGLGMSLVKKKSTNFFTILMVFSTIIFFIIYKKQPRLKENVKRAIRHPYGFFVDLRERRIIPIFNSLLVGAFASVILATYLGSFFYYYLDSFWMQEIVSVFLIPLGAYNIYLSMGNNPFFITLLFFTLLLIYPFLVSIILFIINIISVAKIRFRQGLAIGLWSGIPLFYLLPVSMFGFHLLYHLDNKIVLFLILGLFIVWAHFRIINGIRVLFVTKATKVFIIMLLSYVLPFVIFWFVFRPEPYWYDYLALLIGTKILF